MNMFPLDVDGPRGTEHAVSQSVSQSVSGQSKGRNGSAVVVRVGRDGDGGEHKKVDGFLGGRKKGGDHVQSSVWRIAH